MLALTILDIRKFMASFLTGPMFDSYTLAEAQITTSCTWSIDGRLEQAFFGEDPVGGNDAPEYREGKYETIYDPERVDIATRDVMTNQQQLGNDSVQIEAGQGRGTLEGDVPYTSVIGEYASGEAKSAESENLTAEQREWVAEYFRLLTEQQ